MPPLLLFRLVSIAMPARRTRPPADADAPTEKREVQLADNRRARFDYQIEDRMEAGIALRGTEIKSLRAGRAKVELGVARGRKRYDKRQVIKEREATREMDVAIRRRVGRG